MPIVYWNTLKTQHLILRQFLPENQIISVIDNEMDKSDRLACIRYKNQNVLAQGYRDRKNSRATQILKSQIS